MPDNSEQYIKMCNCKEIQKEWKPKKTDIIFVKETEFLKEHWPSLIRLPLDYVAAIVDNEIKPPIGPWIDKKNLIWLPKQDQLQDMVLKNINFAEKISFLHCYLTRIKSDYINSIEQSWLSFLMSYNYNKEWDGEKWI